MLLLSSLLRASIHTSASRFMAAAPKPLVVFVLGGPGAGKGTQCERIVANFGFKHLSAGDLLREERNSGSETAQLIDSYIKEGKIVPVAITIGLIEKAMQTSGMSRFLIDGFPRNRDNFDGWEEQMKGKVDVKFVLLLDCPKEACMARILERSKTSGRNDDNAAVFEKRFVVYEQETREVVETFESKGLVRRIDATRTVDEVYEDVKALFGTLN